MQLALTSIAQADPDAVEALLDAAFGEERRARTAYRLRAGAGTIPALSFAAWNGDQLVGTLQSWPVALVTPSGATNLILVGPVAVSPAAQGRGVGGTLMDALIATAQARAEPALVMIGDEDYYGRWGFAAGAASGWRIDAGPYEQHRLLARLIGPVAETGVLTAAADVRPAAMLAA